MTTHDAERRSPSLNGAVSTPYGLAVNLWHAAHDHKKHCGYSCCVSLTQMQLAATRLMRDGVTILEERDFAKWEWPL